MRSSTVIEDLFASQQYDIGFAETPVRRASIHQTDHDLECVCIVPTNDPLASLPLSKPGSYDAAHATVYIEFNIQRHLISRRTLNILRAKVFAGWHDVIPA